MSAEGEVWISFSLNIFDKNIGVVAMYFILYDIRKHVMNVRFFHHSSVKFDNLVKMVTARSLPCKSTFFFSLQLAGYLQGDSLVTCKYPVLQQPNYFSVLMIISNGFIIHW